MVQRTSLPAEPHERRVSSKGDLSQPGAVPKAPQERPLASTPLVDYVSGADRSDPETLLDQVAAWIADYNTVAPHSALGYRSPLQYRAERLAQV